MVGVKAITEGSLSHQELSRVNHGDHRSHCSV